MNPIVELPEFEAWLRTVCFQTPTLQAYDLAKSAWKQAKLSAATEINKAGEAVAQTLTHTRSCAALNPHEECTCCLKERQQTQTAETMAAAWRKRAMEVEATLYAAPAALPTDLITRVRSTISHLVQMDAGEIWTEYHWRAALQLDKEFDSLLAAAQGERK